MDRRIRVKCVECEASIELKVDQQELLDVTCPRCHHVFTAKVPPLIVALEPVEVFEPVEETPPVRMTRVVQPAAAAPRPKRVRQIPQSPSSGSASYANSTWQAPLPQYQAAPRVSVATHLKAILIATLTVVGLGVLIMVGLMVKSAISSVDWSADDDESTNQTQLASTDPLSSETSSSIPVSNSTNIDSPSSPDALPSSAASSSSAASAKPDANDVTAKVIMLAEQISQATKDQDHEFVLDRTYPKLIEIVGGRAKMLEILNKALEPMKTQGITIANYTISRDTKIRQTGKNIFVVLPTVLDLNYQGRIMRTDSFLLAISEDSGRTFTFLDGSGAAKNRGLLKRLLPQLPDDFALPVPGTPREVAAGES